jgi:hypothetical protein
MAKWIVQLQSTRQVGAETTVQGILIVVENSGKEERIKAGRIFHHQKFGMLWIAAQQPGNVCTNEGRSRVQCIKLV